MSADGVRLERAWAGWTLRTEDYCSVAEAARIAGASTAYVRLMAARGQIRGEKIGGSWVVLRGDVARFVRIGRGPGQRKRGIGRPQMNGPRFQEIEDGFPDGCVVYVIWDGSAHYKIGKAVNIQKRLKQLQTGNGRRLRLVAYLRCENESQAYLAELAAQRSIEGCRSVGEWFECDSHTATHALHDAQQLVGIVDPPVELDPDDERAGELPGGTTHGR